MKLLTGIDSLPSYRLLADSILYASFPTINEETQSQAEYTIMMCQGAAGKRVTVIGSHTAGADGNVTAVRLPGGYTSYFSGLEVLYPDGSQTQQTGIRINIKVEPTVKGSREGKDEVLQRAIKFIESGK